MTHEAVAKTLKRQDRESRDVPWPGDRPVPRTGMTSPKQPTDLEFSIRRQSDITLAVTAILRSGLPDVFPADEHSRVGIIVSELGTNILKYAGHGVVRVRYLATDGRNGMRVVAEDHGPGIADLEAALKNGFSTGGTLGLGLPAVRRLTDTLNITCPPGGGTRVEAIRWFRRPLRVSDDRA